MANPRDAAPATSAERVNPDFPTLARPDPENPVIAQQAVRVGEHEKMLADEDAHPEKRVDRAIAEADAAAAEAKAAADRAKDAGERAKQVIADRRDPDHPVDFGDPSPARPMGTAQDHKDFLDSNNIRTEEQAERESGGRPKSSNSPGDDVDAPSKEPMNKVTKPHANQTPAKK